MSTKSIVLADAKLLADIERHDHLWSEWNRILVESSDDDPRIDLLSAESVELEKRIVATPAHTAAALHGKRRIIERSELRAWDRMGLIETILDIDAERIAAAA